MLQSQLDNAIVFVSTRQRVSNAVFIGNSVLQTFAA